MDDVERGGAAGAETSDIGAIAAMAPTASDPLNLEGSAAIVAVEELR